MDIVFDANGLRGHNGRDGRDGADGAYGSGSDGQDGEYAGQAVPGTPGGLARTFLASGAADPDLKPDEILVSGHFETGHGGQLEVHEQLGAPQLGSVIVSAIGGRGGDGGVGGNGGDGGRGRRGRDASRYSDGGNGGPGGDGGDGGSGSDGADGGAGGSILVDLDDRDTYLLMAVRGAADPTPLVQGGAGGRRGAHGAGGAGGSGGSGGSSYSWTTSESYTDINGKRQTRTKSHRRSGGFSGRSGRPGSTPTHPLHHGRDAPDGRFEIVVRQADGTDDRYRRRFDLELGRFEVVEADGPDRDGIYEFGEQMVVRNLLLCNVGGMPTPAHQRVQVTLGSSEWIAPIGDELFIDKSLAVGEEIVLPGPLRFEIEQVDITDPADPFVATDRVRPVADQLGVELPGRPASATPFQRRYSSVRLFHELPFRFPIENQDGIEALRSVGPGERTRIHFDVTNISKRAIGTESSRARLVAVQLELVGGDVGPDDLLYLDNEGREHTLDREEDGIGGYYVEIPRIEAAARATVRGQIGFRPTVRPYQGAELRFSILCADIEDRSKLRVVQRRQFTLRSEPAYVYRPDSRVVLVTNNNTRRRAFLAWHNLLGKKLGLGADSWSLSRYGHFDQRHELADGTDLYAHLENKVALILNNPFNPRSSEETDLPTEYLNGCDFRQGATANNTHLFIVGSKVFEMRQLLEPSVDFRASGDDYPTFGRFLKKEKGSGGPLMQETFRDDITLIYDLVQTHTWWFPFMRPKVRRLYKKARRLMRKLARMHPNRRYLIVGRPLDVPERSGRTWLVLPRWFLGQLEVRRTLNLETSSAVVLHGTDEELADEAFIHSREVRFATLLSLPFEDKLDRLNWLLGKCDELDEIDAISAEVLILAIVVDLTEEQVALRCGRGRLDEAFLREKLSNLLRLVEFPFISEFNFRSPKWTLFIDLVSRIEAMARVQKRWWMLWGRNRAITKFTLGVLEQFSSALFDRYAIDPEGEIAMDRHAARPRIDELVRGFLARIKVFRKQINSARVKGMSTIKAGRWFFQRPQGLTRDVIRDIDVFSDPMERIWAPEDLERAQQRERAREKKQEQLRELNRQVRSDLLVVEPAAVPSSRAVVSAPNASEVDGASQPSLKKPEECEVS